MDVTTYRVEAPPGELSPPLVSEAAAHDWAASNRRGADYVIHVRNDSHQIAQRTFPARPS